MRTARLLLALLAAGSAAAQSLPPELRFVSCPLYRDTDAGKKSGCWLADDYENGQRYDISQAPTKADRGHAVLVEGREQGGPINACGSAPLLPVRVSVLWDVACTPHQLEAESYTGRKYLLPKRVMSPNYTAQKVGPVDQPRDFVIPFDYDSSFLTYQLSDYYIQHLVNYALASHAKAVILVAYADTKPVTISGTRLAEPAALAAARAEMVRRWLVGLGVPASVISIRTSPDPTTINHEAFDGLQAPSRRRVEAHVVPADAATR